MNEAQRIIKEQNQRGQDLMQMMKSDGVTIKDLPTAESGELTDLFEVQKGHESQKVTMKQIAEAIGGGSNTTDYTTLINKPQIGGVNLEGNKTADDLWLMNLNESQKISGQKTFVRVIKIEDESGIVSLDLVRNNQTICRIGCISSSSDSVYVQYTGQGHLVIRNNNGAPNQGVRIEAKNDQKNATIALSGDIVTATGARIRQVAAPSDNTDAANKQYVDGLLAAIKAAAASAGDFDAFKAAIARL